MSSTSMMIEMCNNTTFVPSTVAQRQNKVLLSARTQQGCGLATFLRRAARTRGQDCGVDGDSVRSAEQN